MIEAVRKLSRDFVRDNFSPEGYVRTRYLFWLGNYYLPHLIASPFVKRTPKLRGSSAVHSPKLASQLEAVNVFVPTNMCRVITRHGSDKGWGHHNYTAVYSVLFDQFRNLPIRIFEVGLGSHNPLIPANVGGTGRPGGSLRGWRELFPKAFVYGADIDREIIFEEHRIKTFYCDQLDSAVLQDLWSHPELKDGVDIIIDDGLHTYDGNLSLLESSYAFLRPGGIYIVEDVVPDALPQWDKQLDQLHERFPNDEFALIEMTTRDKPDNNLFIIRKHA
jgi:SAM-dependent methyltransferase